MVAKVYQITHPRLLVILRQAQAIHQHRLVIALLLRATHQQAQATGSVVIL